MRGIKECVNWMIDNPNKELTADSGYNTFYDGIVFKVKHNHGKISTNQDFGCFNYYEWEPVKESVDFMTAINSGKKIYPVEYSDGLDKKSLIINYEAESDYYKIDGLWIWLAETVTVNDQIKYINGMWYIEE